MGWRLSRLPNYPLKGMQAARFFNKICLIMFIITNKIYLIDLFTNNMLYHIA